jgi:Uma2 family endonuclease
MSRDTVAFMAWHYTIAEYVELEKRSSIKHEYINGEIRVMGGVADDGEISAMGGGTIAHARLAVVIGSMLSRQLEGRRCAVFSSDARLRIEAEDAITYPDLVVCCGSVDAHPNDRLAIVNPVAIVEITSPSSDRYDRGAKLDRYKLIDTLRDIVIVAYREREIEVHHRNADGTWTVARGSVGERVNVNSINCVLDVDAVYHDPLAAS